jgi:hypothetical protein
MGKKLDYPFSVLLMRFVIHSALITLYARVMWVLEHHVDMNGKIAMVATFLICAFIMEILPLSGIFFGFLGIGTLFCMGVYFYVTAEFNIAWSVPSVFLSLGILIQTVRAFHIFDSEVASF